MKPFGQCREQSCNGLKLNRMWLYTYLSVHSSFTLLPALESSRKDVVAGASRQGVMEELRCLGLLNALDKEQNIPEHLVHLFGEPCIKLAEGIKAYISKVTESIILKHAFAASPPSVSFLLRHTKTLPHRSPCSAFHPLLPHSSGSTSAFQAPQADLHQSCRHPVRSWGNQSFGSHLHNMTLANGRLRVPRSGRYYVYSQVYFRYPSPSEGDQRSASHQLVQCVYKKTSYARPIQLLKGVGTKCWAPDAEYALHSVHQGGLFELRAGDELFVSVSSPSTVHAEDSSSYFGAFQLDL
uniref:Tumor necrosis factor ligand superfamily member 10 n=1 Tax=Scleropages formosus TaxID=113540 RepID=A0A8C9V7B9_SCLFO